jgi:hypothetical protein
MSTVFSFYSVIEYVVCNYLLRIEARIEGGRKRAQEYKSIAIKKKEVQRRKSRSSLEMAPDSATTKDPPGADLVADVNGADGSTFEDLEEPVITVTKRDFIKSGFNYKVDTWLLNNKGEMRFKDQHVDIFSRYVYPIAYTTTCFVLWLIREK